MIEITQFNPALAKHLPETHALLVETGLRVHDAVERITLHGSRGPRGEARLDSDLDLCLVVKSSSLAAAPNQDAFLRAVLNTTLQHWQSEIELDLATVFDRSPCGLRCLDQTKFSPGLCANTIDCIGLFKIQKGFDGFVSGPAVDCSKIHPLMTIWDRRENNVQHNVAHAGISMNEITIRAETPSDYSAIRDLIIQVFRETYGSSEDEATLVERLRQRPDLGANISLVAELDGVLVGHIFFSAVRLADHPDVPVCALAPLGVYRQYQRQGIGSQLVRRGVRECRDQGYRAVFVSGSLEYYPRFGFIPIAGTLLHTVFESDHDLVLELERGLLDEVSGLVAYPEPWHVFL